MKTGACEVELIKSPKGWAFKTRGDGKGRCQRGNHVAAGSEGVGQGHKGDKTAKEVAVEDEREGEGLKNEGEEEGGKGKKGGPSDPKRRGVRGEKRVRKEG